VSVERGALPNKALQQPSASRVSVHRRSRSLRSRAALAAWRRNSLLYHPVSALAAERRSVGRRGSVMTKHVPEGWPIVIPRIAVDDAEALVGFIKNVFGAVGEFHPERPSELRIGDSLIMVGSTIEREEMPAFLYVYVQDADAVFRRALEMGAKTLEEPQDMPYGDRRAMVRDPWGNTWQVATHRGRFTP
jgi:PhnB protein